MKMLKLVIFAAVVLAGTSLTGFGNARAANPPINGVLRVHPDNPRYFTDDSGKAIYLAGWNCWGNLQDGFTNAYSYNWGNPSFEGIGGFDGYLDSLTADNLNYIRLWLYETPRVDYGLDRYLNYQETDYPDPLPWVRVSGHGTANDGGLKFDVTQFNQAYFDRLRERVQAAQDKGIYVSVMLFEGFSLYDADLNIDGYSYHSWKFHPFNPVNNINGIPDVTDAGGAGHKLHTKITGILSLQEAYARKVIDTVNGLDNVLFEIANESANTFSGNDKLASKDWELHMINYIQNYEKNTSGYKEHPVGATSNTFIYAESNVDQDMLDPAVNPSEFVSPMGNCCSEPLLIYYDNPPISDGRKIIIAETDHFGTWDIRGGKDKLRPLLNDTIPKQLLRAKRWPWKSFTRGLHPSLLRKDPNDALGWDEAVRRMGQTRIYAEKMNLAAMTPVNDNSCSSTNYCLAGTGSEYLVYQSGSGAFNVNLPAGDYNYEWFDPVTSLIIETGTTTAIGGNKSFVPPVVISEDAVLYLKSDSTVSTQKVIRLGDTWNYYKGTSTPDASWTGLSFTGSWLDAGITTIGRGSGYATTLTGTNYTTFYARKNFTISDSSAVVSMRLHLGYDDGFAAYINGQEIARSDNMPAGTPNYTTVTGSSHEVGESGIYDLTSHIASLQDGDNILAVEIHNKDTSAGDIGISPELEITSSVPEFAPADVNNDTRVNIKDIQICIKAIVAPGSFINPDQLNQLAKCEAVALPDTTVNIKDIQAIIRKIVSLSQ